MSDDDRAPITIVEAQRGVAVKKRGRSADGKETKSDPAQKEYFWRIRQYRCPADVDKFVDFRRKMAPRCGLATVYGDPAPGLDPNAWHRRLSAESWGDDRTLRSAPRNYIICDFDDAPMAADSPLIKAENLPALAEHGHDNWLPPALRDTDMAVAASSSTGFKASYHGYLMLPELVPQPLIYNYFFGAKAAHFPLDPKPMLPGQLFLTGRPLFWGLDDPVPEHLRAFVLRGRRRHVAEIDWHEFDKPAALYRESEHRAPRRRSRGLARGP